MKSLSCPPLAGVKHIQAGPLSLEAALGLVSGPGFGAVLSFEGRVRGEENGLPISAITYEAYEEMAEQEIEKIISAAQRRWKIRVAVFHRVGAVAVGQAGLVVACAGVHREEAFAACRHVVDAVKADVPIWKTKFE